MEWTLCHCWPLQGAILVCYGWGEGRLTSKFGGVDVVPLLAIAGCHSSVLWLGGGVKNGYNQSSKSKMLQ